MIIRRAFYHWQFVAAVALPVWILVGWGVFGQGGWGILGLLLVCPVVFVTLTAVSLLVYARPTVRRERAVSWTDVALFTVWHGAVIGFGFFGSTTTLFAVLGVLAAIAGFWISLWELFTDGARSMRVTLDAFEQAAMPSQPAAGPGVPRSGQRGEQPAEPAGRPGSGSFPGDGEVIVIREARE
ncbi:hypothetical protein [Luethyella okanaganae]|uniref:MFS transporter n=1 Tax=Luethyella okanaganae TaxID=69372 RepID=A0ABW1VBB4_9MICO